MIYIDAGIKNLPRILVLLAVFITLFGCEGQEPKVNGMEKTVMIPKIAKGEVLPISVVFQAGCANTPPTIERIEKVASQLGVEIVLEKVVIATQEEAEANRFQGSPTVFINGVDLDPEMRKPTKYGFT